jgi:hypothetical protein
LISWAGDPKISPMDAAGLDDLLDHLAGSTRLGREEAARVVAEVIAYFGESPAQFVTRRHRELQAQQLTNAAIFARIAEELRARRFRAPELTARQLRRLVYG